VPKIYGELQEATFQNLSTDPGGNVAGKVWHNTTESRVKVDDGTLKRALLKNDQHAVIGNHATPNNNIRLHRGADGVLQFVTGGDVTAEGTLSTALNQLSHKVESYTDAGKPAFGNLGRLIYLTDVESFAFDNGTAWDKIRLLRPQIAQITSNHSTGFTAVVGQGVYYCDASAGAFSVAFPSPSGVSGEILELVKTDGTFNVVTLTGVLNGGTLNTQNEKVTVRSNGTNWLVESRYIPSTMVTTTLTPNAAAFGTISNALYFIKRFGDCAEFRFYFKAGTTANVAGTLTLPAGITIDFAKTTGGAANKGLIHGSFFTQAAGAATNFGSTNRLGAFFIDTSGSTSVVNVTSTGTASAFNSGTPGVNNFLGGNEGITGSFLIPISGWNG
jgi:hypothetical protein